MQAFRIWSRTQPGATTRSASSSPLTSARLPSQPCQAVLGGRRIRPDRAADDAGVRDGEREPVAGRESERCIERFIVIVRHDEQAGESAIDLLGGKAVRMRMEPVQPGAVLHLEAQAFARTRSDRIEAGAVLRLRERQAVEMDGGGLRQRVLDHGVEALAAPCDEDRLRHPSRAEVRHVAATAGERILPLDDETRNGRERATRSPANAAGGGTAALRVGGTPHAAAAEARPAPRNRRRFIRRVRPGPGYPPRVVSTWIIGS